MEITNVELGRFRLSKFVPSSEIEISAELMAAIEAVYPDIHTWSMAQVISEQKRLQETLPPLLASRESLR